MPGREPDDEIAVEVSIGIWRQKQTTVRRLRKRPDNAFNVSSGVLDGSKYKLDHKRGSRSLGRSQIVFIIDGRLGIDHKRGA